MSNEIVFYYNPMSRARTVHWMLEEVGQPYRLELMDFSKGEHKQPGFLAINPMGKVPALVHRGAAVTETGAICAYLADAFPAAGLAPPLDSPQRGTYYRWMFFAAGCLEPAMIDRMLDRPPSDKRSSMGYGCYDDTVNVLEKVVTQGPFILGDRFSAVDVYIGSQMGFAMRMKSLESRPAFGAYLARVSERPAFKRTMEQSDKYVAQLKATA
jgi:glutathione S-transferase